MAVLLITYTLRKKTARPPIVEAIKKIGSSWAKLSECSYAITARQSPGMIYNELSEIIDENDDLYVIALQRPHFGQGPAAVYNWLRDRLP